MNVPNIFGDLFDYLYEYNPWFARFHRSLPDMFWMEYEWDGHNQHRDTRPFAPGPGRPRVPQKDGYSRNRPSTSVKRTAITVADEFLPEAAKNLITKTRRKKRTPARKVSLESILACPNCGGDVKMMRDAVKCQVAAVSTP